jgi:nicotinamide-nucleotide amidase
MNAVILSIGNELVNGSIVDTNSAYLADRLSEMGIHTLAHWTVSDDFGTCVDAFSRAAAQAQVVIATGGLGPTPDDLTRAALAEAMGSPLIRDEAMLEEITAFFALRGWPMNETNACQADRPDAARAISNAMGTAPGLVGMIDSATIYCLPGVPHEMKAMFESSVSPNLPRPEGVILRGAVHTCGMGESAIGQELADLIAVDGDTRIGTTASLGIVSIRLQIHAADRATGEAKLAGLMDDIRGRLAPAAYGINEETLASVIGRDLQAAGQTLATAESCTGGGIGKLLTDVPGSSSYYLGGVVAYDNRIKEQLLGVDADLLNTHGAVSEPVAGAMAAGARDGLGSDWAISTTGIAGPGGGTEAKPVGMVCFGLAGPDGVTTYTHRLHGTREFIRLRASVMAINLLRHRLSEST